MSEPIKPKRRVTAQIPITSSPKFPPTTPQSTYPSPASRPAIRARVDPSSASGSSTPTSRPSLRPSQSSASIRASASLPAVPTLHAGPSRPRSPVRVRSPLPPSGSSSVPSSTAGGGTRARVRASSPAQGGLTRPLNQSYAQNTGTATTGVRARVTNVAPITTGSAGRSKGFPSDAKEETTAGPSSQPRPKVSKSQTQPPLTPLPPAAPRSRGSSVVSSSPSAPAKVVSSPLHSPQLGPPISPAYSLYLQTPGAGPSTPGLGTDRRRSLSPVRRVQNVDLPNLSTGPAHRPYPLTPTLSPISGIAHPKPFNPDPIASCPPSPHHTALPPKANGKPRRLPDHPFAARPAGPPSPVQPELKIVDLPPLSTTASREEAEVGQGVDDGGGGVLGLGLLGGLDLEGRLAAEVPSEDRAVDAGPRSAHHADAARPDVPAAEGDNEGDTGQSGLPLDDVVEEARINRKVADLEISNASLLAINRSLEISKSKQRAEILRLRRALRESLAGPILPTHPSSTSYFPSSTPRPHPVPSFPFSRMFSHPLLDAESEEEDDMPGLEGDLDARWAKLEDVIGSMQKRAEAAVEAVAEESRPVGRTVLGDWEDEEGEGEGMGTGGIGTPERHGEG